MAKIRTDKEFFNIIDSKNISPENRKRLTIYIGEEISRVNKIIEKNLRNIDEMLDKRNIFIGEQKDLEYLEFYKEALLTGLKKWNNTLENLRIKFKNLNEDV